MNIIDTNIDLSHWPFRRLQYDDTTKLVAKLRSQGVVQAWAGSFDGLLHKDLAAVNERLADECKRLGKGILLPFGSINPTLPDWEEDLRRCHEELRMPGIRLHPNYHGYKLSEPVFVSVLKAATARGLAVQLAVLMEDRRMQHKLLPMPPVELDLLPKIVKEIPKLRLHVMNAMQHLRGPLLLSLVASGQVFFDTATVEGVGGVGNLLNEIPDDRLFFGSHAPFFIFESAFLKLKESPLSDAQRQAVVQGNAKRFLSGYLKK